MVGIYKEEGSDDEVEPTLRDWGHWSDDDTLAHNFVGWGLHLMQPATIRSFLQRKRIRKYLEKQQPKARKWDQHAKKSKRN